MKENIKLALLGLIAVTLIINTFMKGEGTTGSDEQNASKPVSSAVVATPSANVNVQPNAPIAADVPKTLVVFDEYDYNFGDVAQNSTNEKIFKFKNTGKEPLIITNAKGSCGCTVPEYPKEPIAPGKTGDIKVVYSPGNQQFKQEKSITITANTDPETTVLKVYANVIPTEGTPAG
ncbi:MAG TPA: hypothetical protein DCX54_13665 [Flavobacteriales bacterium]|nr:hypothetical protein [Flavobacteriales bacterium]